MNTNYAKFIDSHNLEYAPTNIEIGTTWYIPGQPEHYIQAGYKEVVNTPYPDDGKYYESSWEEKEEEIVQVWTETDPPPGPEPYVDPILDLQEAVVDQEYRITLLELGV